MIEKIIIDGVDVSQCHHYKNRACIADYCYTDMEFSEAKCSLSPNCYYKQLQRTKAQYNKVVEQNKSLQSELLLARSEVSQKTDYIREQLEIIKQLKDKNRELRIETARLSNELTIDIKKQLKQKENEIAHQKTLTETYRACYLAKHEDLAKELENKKQECEELKEEIEILEDNFNSSNRDWEELLDNYKQALDEIEKLTTENLEKYYNHCKYAKGCVNTCGINSEVNLKQILDIINKAKEVNNDE